jgi:hypothetical protein
VKIYFTASLTGRQTLDGNYRGIVSELRKLGYKVFAEHIIADNAIQVAVSQTKEEGKKFYRKMHDWVIGSDLVVAEISYPSVSVGHEISFALELGKSVLVLCMPGRKSLLLEASDDKKLMMVEYTLENLAEVLPKAVEEAKKNMDVRFNFFVSPRILGYLDWVAEKKRTPRSVFLRQLIEKEMRKDKTYIV